MARRNCFELVSKVSSANNINSPGLTPAWCRCDAEPKDLDALHGTHDRTHEKTDFLIENFKPDVLWDNFGI